jgi:glycine/D-amino acid oxidase-like deaminating enzyme
MSSRRFVVIGAGILGASLAARLAADGQRVTLLDQDQPGRATSRWSFAWINSNDKGPRPYHDLNHAGIRAWAELAPNLDGDAWYRPSGHVELAASGAAELESRVRRLTDWGYPARLVSLAEAAALEPALDVPSDAAAAFFPDEGYILTKPLIARLVAYAESRGADVRTGEPGRVTGLDPGTPARVRTADGAVLDADDVICCVGRWTPALAALSGSAEPVPLIPWTPPARPPPAWRSASARLPRRARSGCCTRRISPCARTPAACCTWRPRTLRPPWTCTRRNPSCAAGPPNSSTVPAAPSAASTMPRSRSSRSASARSPPTSGPSWDASPAPRASTSRLPTAA